MSTVGQWTVVVYLSASSLVLAREVPLHSPTRKCNPAAVFLCLLQQRKIQESARYQTLMESITKLEKSVEV